MTTVPPATPEVSGLFASGPFAPTVEQERQRVAAALAEAFSTPPPADGTFPRSALRTLGESGLFRRRWSGDTRGDPGLAALIAEESGALGHASLSTGLSLHAETALSILQRFSASDALQELREGALDGRLVGCLGASEPGGGSNLNGVSSLATRTPQGWRLQGEKKYVSMGLVCDFALVLCRLDEGKGPVEGRLGLFAVPRGDLIERKRLQSVGMPHLDTTWFRFDTTVPDDLLVTRPGLGLLAVTWGLTHERLSIAGQAVGQMRKAIELTQAHLLRREQFGRPLVEHQALRMRLGELCAQAITMRYAVYGAAMGMAVPGGCGAREAAALKVTAGRLGGHVLSECMHLFGGAGYLTDETPLARMWIDARLARLGGGSDEMMWELVANGIVADQEAYAAEVHLS